MNRFFLGLVAMMLVIMLAGCNATDVPVTETSAPSQTETLPQTEEKQDYQSAAESDSETGSEIQTDNERVAIETQFGTLYYQEQWREFMRVEMARDGDSMTVNFEAEINAVRYPLFQIILGHGEGEPVAQITAPDGVKSNVYVGVYELGEYPMLTEGEQNRLYAMQEDINFVIENLK